MGGPIRQANQAKQAKNKAIQTSNAKQRKGSQSKQDRATQARQAKQGNRSKQSQKEQSKPTGMYFHHMTRVKTGAKQKESTAIQFGIIWTRHAGHGTVVASEAKRGFYASKHHT